MFGIFEIISIIIIGCMPSACVAELFDGCDTVKNLTAGESYTYQSPGYSYTNIWKRYEPGSSCRLHLVAPPGYIVRLSGRISLDRKLAVFTCIGQGQKFLVSRDGMKDFYRADIFCSIETIIIDSVSNEMTVGYISDLEGAGRFQLTAKAVPLTKDNCECGWGLYSFTKQNSPQLFQGYTSVAALHHKKKDEIVCTAIIVSRNYLIAGAHCLANEEKPSEALQVLVGYRSYPSDDFPQFQKNYDIDSVKIHEKYDKASVDQQNDIALIKVKEGMRFSRGVSPICLPTLKDFSSDYFFYKSRSLDLVAWNKYNNDGLEQFLLNATVSSISNSECSRSFKKFNITNNHLCTSVKTSKTKNPEYPGASLIYPWNGRKFLIGIFNDKVEHTQPVIFTKIASYLQWINSGVSGDFMCRRYY